jgi:hypothetical protein
VKPGIRRYVFVGIAFLAGIAELLALFRARHRYGPDFR